MEFGPAQIAAILLAVVFIGLGLAGGRVPWRSRLRRRNSSHSDLPPAEHQQFMRPSGSTTTTATDDATESDPFARPHTGPDQDD